MSTELLQNWRRPGKRTYQNHASSTRDRSESDGRQFDELLEFFGNVPSGTDAERIYAALTRWYYLVGADDSRPPTPPGYTEIYSTDRWRQSNDPNIDDSILANGYDAFVLQNDTTGELIIVNVGSEGTFGVSPDWLYNWTNAVPQSEVLFGGQIDQAFHFLDYVTNSLAGSNPTADGLTALQTMLSGITAIGNSLGGGIAEAQVALNYQRIAVGLGLQIYGYGNASAGFAATIEAVSQTLLTNPGERAAFLAAVNSGDFQNLISHTIGTGDPILLQPGAQHLGSIDNSRPVIYIDTDIPVYDGSGNLTHFERGIGVSLLPNHSAYYYWKFFDFGSNFHVVIDPNTKDILSFGTGTAPTGTNIEYMTGDEFAALTTSFLLFGPANGAQQITSFVKLGPGLYEIIYADASGTERKATFYDQNGMDDGQLSADVLVDGEYDPQSNKYQKIEITVNNQNLDPIQFSALGNIVGSSIGRLLAGGDNRVEGLVASSVVGVIGLNLGQYIDFQNGVPMPDVIQSAGDVFDDFGTELRDSLKYAAIGSVSSFLVMELGESIGLEGFGSELFNTVGTTTLSRVLSNVAPGSGLHPFAGFNSEALFGGEAATGTAGFLSNAVGSFIGAQLGSIIVSPQTQAGQVLSSLGASIGGFLLGGSQAAGQVFGSVASQIATGFQFLGRFADLAAPGIGSLVGFVLGALIGNLFGSKKPKIPTANAETVLNFDTGYYELGQVTSQDGGNEDLVSNMAEAAKETLNGIISLVVEGSEIAGNANLVSPTQVYGQTGADLWVKLGGSSAPKTIVSSADEAVEKGALWAIRQTKISGGDLFLKRVIYNSAADSLLSVFGDFEVAKDYSNYHSNREFFDHVLGAQWQRLSAGDRSFYSTHSSAITRISARDKVSLSSSDLNFYNANQTQIDRILDASAISPAAAGYILTLTRAAELGIDQTSKSDFYGGMAGFADSLKQLARSKFEYEDVDLKLNGTMLQVDYGRANDPLDNVLRGGDLSLGTAPLLKLQDVSGAATETIERLDDGSTAMVFRDSGAYTVWTSGPYSAAIYEFQGGNLEGGRAWSVNPGDQMSFGFESRRLGSTQNRLYMFAFFYRADGSYIGNFGRSDSQSTDWTTHQRTVTVPAEAATARIRLYTFGRVGPSGSVPNEVAVAGRNFHLNISDSAFSSTPTYSTPALERWNVDDFISVGASGGGYRQMSGTQVTNVSQEAQAALIAQAVAAGRSPLLQHFTLVSSTNQDNSGANDYYQHTAHHGVTIDDSRVETATMFYTYWVQNGYELMDGVETVTLTHEGGDDIFIGGSGNDTLRGRSGFDWLEGGDGDDKIYGGDHDDVILGGDGSDRLCGENGDDYIHLGDGRNYYKTVNGVWTAYGAWGGNGDDTIIASGTRAFINAQADNDTVILTESTTGWSRYIGGAGEDTLSFERYSSAIDINIGTLANHSGSSGWQTFGVNQHFVQFENFTATQFDDTLTGDAGNNVLRGLDGDDTLNGGAGSDTLEGGAGADHLIGGDGAGDDTVSYENSDFAVWIDWSNGQNDAESFGGDAEGDTFSQIDFIRGSSFDDTFTGDAGSNAIYGGRGDDWFVATSGNDHFHGEEDFDTIDYSEYTSAVYVNLSNSYGYQAASGHRYFDIEHAIGSNYNDNLTGGSEDNVFQGGQGNDILKGGAGLDTYIFHNGDGQDKISESLSNGGWDTLMFGDGIGWADLQYSGGANIGSIAGETNSSGLADMRFSIRGTSHRVDVYDNWTGSPNSNNGHREAKIDSIDVGGVGAVDIKYVEGGAFGTDNNNTLYGDSGWDRGDLIFAYAGDDTIYAAGSDDYDTRDNIIVAGRGNDTIHSSVGDDQYVFERGDGIDTIYDSGGADRIQFGPDIAAEDVIFEIIGTSLYIGIRDLDDPMLSASQVADRIHVMHISESQQNTVIEYITAAGFDIDLRKLDLWNAGRQDSGGGGSSPHPPTTPPPPPGNTAPNAVDDQAYALMHNSGRVGVLANDSDADGHSLTVDQINGVSISVGQTMQTSGGNTVQLNDGGLITFTSSGAPGLTDSFTYRINDGHGGYDTATVNVNIIDLGGGGGFLFPIVIDLDGDGADMISVTQSRVVYENDGGGPLWRAGWVGADDGILALDRDGDGTINRLSEISFIHDYEGATTDLEGLRGFDSNKDGVFSASDERWGDFQIWQDVNQNGVGTSRELMSLAAAGITRISLGLTDLGNELQGNQESVILNETAVTFRDGSETSAFDVALNIQLAHIRGTSLENFDELTDGLIWAADGAFGVAHYGQRNNPDRLRRSNDWDENNTAALQTEDGLQDATRRRTRNLPLLRYVDEDDSMTAAPAWQPDPNDPVTPSYGVKPLIIDMDGDGLELINPMYSSIEIDGDGDGAYDRMGWISTDDAFLALDRNGDGVISAPSEISFVQDLPGAETDLDGLRAYDSNGDGWFDASDARFGDFTVWQDLDFDGVSISNELTSLAEAGITRIGLTRAEGTFSSAGQLGNTVFGEAAVVWADGRQGIIGDVELRAFNGNLEEQQLTQFLRNQRQRVGLAAWDFDRTARRAAIEGYRPNDFTGFDDLPELNATGPALSPSALLSRVGEDGHVRNRFAAHRGMSDLNDQPVSDNVFAELGAHEFVSDARTDLALPPVALRHEERDSRFGRRWWMQSPQERLNLDTPVSLTELLAGFDAARDQFNGHMVQQSSLPQETVETLAERQRFLQAVASFRGSSGVATPRRRSDSAYSEAAIIGASSMLRNGAHNMMVP